MSLLHRLFKPLSEIKAELSARFKEEVQPEIDAVVHAVDQVLEHPGRLDEMRERAQRLKNAASFWRQDRAEAHVHWLEVRMQAQVHKALGLATYAALAAAVALGLLHSPAGDGGTGNEALSAAAFVAGLAILVSLSALWLGWPPQPGTLSAPIKEAEWLLDGLVRRAWQVNLAVLAAVLATLLLGWGVGARLFGY